MKAWRLLLCWLLLVPLASAEVSDPAGVFAEGNASYKAGDFEHAVELYRSLLPGHQSASLHFNLGNAYYQLGDYGPAILHFEKALALAPRNPDIRANLQLALEAAEVTPPPEPWSWVVARRLTADAWAWLVAGAFWVMLALWLLPPLYGWRGPLRGGLLFLAVALTLAGGAGLYGWHVRAGLGVVLTDEATLAVAPTASSPAAGAVKTGELGEVRQRHGDYFLVQMDNGKVGWLDQQAFAPVWD